VQFISDLRVLNLNDHHIEADEVGAQSRRDDICSKSDSGSKRIMHSLRMNKYIEKDEGGRDLR
jgi:hypothetical protein